jgi:hypothetical protein
MTKTINKYQFSTHNEDAMPATTDNTLVDILNLNNLVEIWLLDIYVGSLQGIYTSKRFAWRGMKSGIKFEEAVPGYAPGLATDGTDGKPYLRFGYGASQSNSGNTLSQSGGHNGHLRSQRGTQMLFYGTGFTFVALRRTPIVGGVAGTTPGGTIVGNKLNHTGTYDTGVNIRWSGLEVGYATASAGEPRICLNGDARYQGVNSTDLETRDGLWHIDAGRWDYSGSQSMNFRMDGVDRGASDPGGSIYDLNTTTGATELRIGATGLLNSGSYDVLLAGDVRAVAVLKGSVLSECQQVEAYLATLATIG